MAWLSNVQAAQQAKQKAEQQKQALAQQKQNQSTQPKSNTKTVTPLPPDPSQSNKLVQGNTTWQKVATPSPSPSPQPTPISEASKNNNDAFGLLSAIVSNPEGAAKVAVNTAAAVTAKDTSNLGIVANLEIGAAGGVLNTSEDIKNTIVNLGKKPVMESTVKPPSSYLPNAIPAPQPPKAFTPVNQAQEVGQTIFDVGKEVGGAVALTVVAPEVLPIKASSLLKAGAISVGLNELVTVATTGKPDTNPKSIVGSFVVGEGFAIGGAVALQGVSKIAPRVAGSQLGRAGVNSLVGGGGGYLLSGGDVEQTFVGAATGGLFSLGGELAYNPSKAVIMTRLGLGNKMIWGPSTIGKSGVETPTFLSEKPLESLGGKQLRVVADVTENPVGINGVTKDTLIGEYVGKRVPTSHATLKPEAFDLKAGGETVLRGFPEEGAGYRSSQQLYHFYSAPGSEKFVTVYGGYAGVGKGYSGESPKIVFGGKSTALVTLDTEINSGFLKQPKESVSEYLFRTSGLGGKTGLAQETLLGASMERQFITPAKYVRFGKELAGSKFTSEGKVGKFIIQESPSGKVSKIPVIRTMFSKFTELDVYKGKYGPVDSAGVKVVDVERYGASYGKTIKASVPKFALPSSFISTSSKNKSIMPSNLSLSSNSSGGSGSKSSDPIISSRPSIPSRASNPFISSPSSEPSTPSTPSYSSLSSNPIMPSPPSYSSSPPSNSSPSTSSSTSFSFPPSKGESSSSSPFNIMPKGKRRKEKVISRGHYWQVKNLVPTPKIVTGRFFSFGKVKVTSKKRSVHGKRRIRKR